MSRFKFWRKLLGGWWYYHESTGQLPGLYGCWWSRTYFYNPRFDKVTKIENYTNDPMPLNKINISTCKK